MKNGAILRSSLTRTPENVVAGVEELRNPYKSNVLSTDCTERLEREISKIFSDYPNVDLTTCTLDCEIKLLTKYISNIRAMDKRIESANFSITTRSEDQFEFSRIMGFVYPYDNGSSGAGCDIMHISMKSLDKYLANTAMAGKSLEILRLVLAHDISHIIIHCNYKSPTSDVFEKGSQALEAEATYCSWLLLKHREFLYHNTNDKIYTDACKNLDKMFRFVYKKYGISWLDCVLK